MVRVFFFFFLIELFEMERLTLNPGLWRLEDSPLIWIILADSLYIHTYMNNMEEGSLLSACFFLVLLASSFLHCNYSLHLQDSGVF